MLSIRGSSSGLKPPHSLLLFSLLLLDGCSVQQLALDRTADALAAENSVFASDNDPELIRDAAPFSLKLMETLIAARPKHGPLLLAATKGFCQYAYAFVQEQADEVEDQDVNLAYKLRARARSLYKRALDYGLQALSINRPNFRDLLYRDQNATLAALTADDVPLLYWTGTAWAAWIALSKDSPDAVADLPVATALLERALALNEAYGDGALHALFINLEPSRSGTAEAVAARAQKHFDRALELSGGRSVAPYVSLAEAVALPAQDRNRFDSLLHSALAVNADDRPESRLETLILQQRARWLLEQLNKLFLEKS